MSSIDVIVNKGDVILKEKPFILLQTIESKKCSLCCSYCTKTIGDWKTQVINIQYNNLILIFIIMI